MAAMYDIYIDQGSDFTETFTIIGDYTGYTVRSNVEDSTETQVVSVASWIDETIGKFKIEIPNVSTTGMSSGVGRYDVEIVDGTGFVTRLIKGRAYIDKEVTV